MILHRRAVLTGLLTAPALIRRARAESSSLLPRWQRFAMPAPAPEGRPIIAIVIDDLGVIHPGTARAVALPAQVTLAWFPFARNLPDHLAAARERGHEALLHMPMQAFGHTAAQTGPDPLRIDLPPEENLRRLITAIDAVPDTVGLNNHMGSVATRSLPLMQLVAEELKRREMLLLDSLTISHSVAYGCAAQAGVAAAKRDVFIDYKHDSTVIRGQLELIEHLAREWGQVIAIGHPLPLTLDAIEEWLPTLDAKGFVLWPVSAVVALRNKIPMTGGSLT
jgi:polysaccharide deacetylase 2 family uncharacterized protein YibQ